MNKQQTLVAHSTIRLNNELFKREIIDGEEHIVVPCSTMPPDIVMNGIFYPEEEVKKAFETLEGTPSPLGHPKIDGKMVSAYDPRGVNKYGVGAWNRNVEYTDKIHYQKAINVRVAKASPYGGDLIEAIEQEKPIHTSTGLFCTILPISGEHNGKQYDGIATGIFFDHDAILLQEPGAATPEDGTGIYVNEDKEKAVSDKKEDNVTVSTSVFNRLLEAFASNKKEGEQEKKEPSVGNAEHPKEESAAKISNEDLEKKIKEVVGNCVKEEIANALKEASKGQEGQESKGENSGKGAGQDASVESNQQNNAAEMPGFALNAGANFNLNAEDQEKLIQMLP